ncbi:MAG TPA: 3-deoxy-7-phosphoheptulonate synthase, partial [Franconibacter helveticus]|nr:3-deoxy-7-phosphoheptulonate synthase [Franconibacter helveticus]
MNKTDELRTARIDTLVTPQELAQRYPVTPEMAEHVTGARRRIEKILNGEDNRLLVVIGPCSIHDLSAAVEYAGRLKPLREKYQAQLEIVMRTYFEKPRTVVGWKGLISDPDLNGSYRVNHGIELARRLLVQINALGVPTATEFLDMVTGQYIADLISWGAIGARTTESQIHREMASALSCPVGFKNGTDGNTRIAVDAIRASRASHMFLSPDKHGRMTIYQTSGNPYGHIIMRGGKQPNYHETDIAAACATLREFNLPERLVVDFGHGNCQKQHRRQLEVCEEIGRQLRAGSQGIAGVMVESFIKEGAQPVAAG